MNRLSVELLAVDWQGVCDRSLCGRIILDNWSRSRAEMTPEATKRWMGSDAKSEHTGTRPGCGATLIHPRDNGDMAFPRLLRDSSCAGPSSRRFETGAHVRSLKNATDVFAAARRPSVNPALIETPKNLSAMKKGHRQDQPSLPLSGGGSSQGFHGLAFPAVPTPSPGQPDVFRGNAVNSPGGSRLG